MSDAPLVEPGDEQERTDESQAYVMDDPTAATNESNIGTVAGTTGPTPLTGGQIVSATTDDPDALP